MAARFIGLLFLAIGLSIGGCAKTGVAGSPQANAKGLTNRGLPGPCANPANPNVVNDGITLVAPQFTMVSIPTQFSLSNPSNATITGVSWVFGDGSSAQTKTGSVSTTYFITGNLTVTATVTDSTGTKFTLSQGVDVLPYSEDLLCINQLAVSIPAQTSVGATVPMQVTVPSCMTQFVTGVQWNFGDGSGAASGDSVTHSYSSAGTFNVTPTISLNVPGVPTITYTGVIAVIAPPPPPAKLCTPTETMAMALQHAQYCYLSVDGGMDSMYNSGGRWSTYDGNFEGYVDAGNGVLEIKDLVNHRVSSAAHMTYAAHYVGVYTDLEGNGLFCYHWCKNVVSHALSCPARN